MATQAQLAIDLRRQSKPANLGLNSKNSFACAGAAMPAEQRDACNPMCCAQLWRIELDGFGLLSSLAMSAGPAPRKSMKV
jgi:hypothetical protein